MKVLIAVDDPHYAALMADYVRNHVWSSNTSFTIVHVIEPILLDHTGDVAFSAFLSDAAEAVSKDAHELVSTLASNIRKACPDSAVETMVLEGKAAKSLIDFVHDSQPELLIVGSHGRRGINRFILGSVSEALLASAPCSVVILRAAAQGRNGKHAESAQASLSATGRQP